MLSSNIRLVHVELIWLKPSEGGRKTPFKGAKYSTVIGFPSITTAEINDTNWSVVLNFDSEETNPSQGVMSFLFDNAPQHLLVPELEFVLLEGKRIVAMGKVIEVIA